MSFIFESSTPYLVEGPDGALAVAWYPKVTQLEKGQLGVGFFDGERSRVISGEEKSSADKALVLSTSTGEWTFRLLDAALFNSKVEPTLPKFQEFEPRTFERYKELVNIYYGDSQE